MFVVVDNGLVVRGDGSEPFVGRVVVEGEKIVYVGPKEGMAVPEGAEVVDAEGCVVCPGGIDAHVHFEYFQGGFRILTADDFHTGSVAAVCGGTTTFVDFVEQAKGETLPEALRKRCEAAEAKSVIDYSFHMTLLDARENTLGCELDEVMEKGVTSFKMYTAYDGIRVEDPALLEIFRVLKAKGGLPIVHSENDALIKHRVGGFRERNETSAENHPACRPIEGEAEATMRVLMLAHSESCRCHIVHVTAGSAMAAFDLANSWPVKDGENDYTGEVCVQHLALTDDVYRGSHDKAADFVCAPPMRPQSDVDAMWEAVKADKLQFVVTDHCPFTRQQRRGMRRIPEFKKRFDGAGEAVERVAEKESAEQRQHEQWYPGADKGELPPFFMMPGGVAGVEVRMGVCFDECKAHGVDLKRYVDMTSTAAAKRYNMYPQKGCLAPGSDADICVINPNKETVLRAETLHMNTDHCPYEGRVLHNTIDTVLVRGAILVKDGQFVSAQDAHRGKFIARPRY